MASYSWVTHACNFTPLILVVAVLMSTIGPTQSNGGDICHGTERLTKLRFYVQDMVGGEKPTVWKVAQCNLTDILPSGFGLVSLLDNAVTIGPDIGSKEVGRIQGLIGLSDFHEKALVMLLNVVFSMELSDDDDDMYREARGSTLNFLGRNPLEEKVREIPVVGGTGAFRMARGYALTSTYSVDEEHTHGVLQYDVVLCHSHSMHMDEIF